MIGDWFRKREREDVLIEVPGVVVTFNHRLKVALLYDYDPGMSDDRYDALEAHLAKRGYFLQVVVASATQGERS